MEEVKLEEVKHSSLGASSSKRWMNCEGSPNLIARLVAEFGADKIFTSNSAADLGTAAHHVASECLKSGSDAWEFTGQSILVHGKGYLVDQDMVDAVQVYLDFVRKKLAQWPGAEVKIEYGMSSITDEAAFGTGDCIINVPFQPPMEDKIEAVPARLIIADYKNGIHICVEPTEEQLRYYGYLAAEELGLSEETIVECWIAQPRMPHPKGPVRQAVYNVRELTAWWNDEVLPAMAATRKPNAPLTMGEWCKFCPAKNHCPAVRQGLAELPVTKAPDAMTEAELADIMLKKKAITDFFAAVETEAFNRAMKGTDIPDHKLVNKQANRTWRDEIKTKDENGKETVVKVKDFAVEKFGLEAMTDPELKSPAQLEKMSGGKPFVRMCAFTPVTGLTLVHKSDRRDATKPAMERFHEQQTAQEEARAVALHQQVTGGDIANAMAAQVTADNAAAVLAPHLLEKAA